MATALRQFQSETFYHVFNRGNHKQPVFFAEADYLYFLEKLQGNAAKYGIEIVAYCLLSNHYHLLLHQTETGDLSRFMLATTTSYVKRTNKRYELVGRLFQERFRAKPILTDEYLLHVSRYIHLNPGAKYQKYEWSSYPWYIGKKGLIPISAHYILGYFDATQCDESYAGFTAAGLIPTPGVAAFATPGVE